MISNKETPGDPLKMLLFLKMFSDVNGLLSRLVVNLCTDN